MCVNNRSDEYQYENTYNAKMDVGEFLDEGGGGDFCELSRKTRRCLLLAGGAFVGLVGDGADGKAGKRSFVAGADAAAPQPLEFES